MRKNDALKIPPQNALQRGAPTRWAKCTIHWDGVHGAKSGGDTDWYWERPTKSLELIDAATPDRWAAIIDIGCGSGVLLRELGKAGYNDLTGLDASAVAVKKAQTCLGEAADRVTWVDVAGGADLQPPKPHVGPVAISLAHLSG